MKKIANDPLVSIFKKSSKGGYLEEIDSISNIPNFFTFISSDKNPEDQKIGVLENLLAIFKKNRYISEYFSYYNKKSIYLYLFDLYLSKKASQKLREAILNLLNEITILLETNKEVYEYLFQSLSKIYSIEQTNQEKTPDNLYNHLSLLNTLLSFKEKIPKPRNYFALSGNCKFFLDLKDKSLNVGYCMSFILNFKIGDYEPDDQRSNIMQIKFSNSTNISFVLKSPSFLYIKEGNEKEKLIKVLPPNEFIVLVINLIVEDNNLLAYFFVNGENNFSPNKMKNNLDIKKDTIESLVFFENFFGEVTSMTMLLEKEKSNNSVNSKDFLPTFKNFATGFHKTKILQKFCDVILEKYKGSTNKNAPEGKSNNNIVFIFTSFNYFHSSWGNNNNDTNRVLNDYYNKYELLMMGKDDSIRNHRYQYYQKKIYLVCDITNFLPIAEMFLIHPQLLTEQNLELYLQIVENIINFRKRNVQAAKETKFFKILCLFIEKYPNQIFTEKILDAFINIGKDMFKNNLDNLEKLTNTYFKNILLNEKILSKYSKNLQIKFWNQLLLFCQSDSEQLETFLKMNRICLIIRFYDKNKYNEMCCKNHLDMFKKEFSEQCNIMKPSMNERLTDIWKIIDLIINSQKPIWVLTLFKLLALDLSPCLTNFITTAIIKALIRHDEISKKNKTYEEIDKYITCKSMVIIGEENSWIKEFIQELANNKYESIIINTFIHSLPDVKYNILKLLYQLYRSLIILDNQKDFKIFFNMMKKYLLPQKMFYEKKGEQEILVINDNSMKQYLNDIIVLFIYWSLEEQLIELNDGISFGKKVVFDKDNIIRNSDILEIIFELIKQVNYDIELILKYFGILSDLIKNPINADTLLYNHRIFLMLIDLVYQCYTLKLNNKDKNNNNIEKAYLLGKTLLSNIYINVLLYKEKNYITDNYPFNEISLIFLYGDKIIFKNDLSKLNEVKNNVFSFLGEFFTELLTIFKLKITPKMTITTSVDVKSNLIKSYYHQNYLILGYKFFQFSFEYELDSLINANQLNSALPNTDVMSYYNLYLTSMKIDDSKGKCISLYWKNYDFFEEIYSKISYIWSKDYLYKDFEKNKFKNSNKVKKYENIVQNIILHNEKRNIFKKELELLCTCYVNENKYDISNEKKDKNNGKENIQEQNILNINLLKQIQIALTGMLYVILAKENESDLLKWVKEMKHFVIFLIIASSNIIIKIKEDKQSTENKFSAFINLQEQCLLAIYNCLSFFNLLRTLSSHSKQKVDKTIVSVYTLCFSILKNTYDYRKKHKISKKFCIGYKYNVNDLSGSAVFVLFNDYIKDKSKEKEKGDHVLMNIDKVNSSLDEKNYSQNIIKLLEDSNWGNSFYLNNSILSEILSQKYYPVNDYKAVVEQRIKTIKAMEEEEKSDNWKYSDDEILQLLPLYEKELVHYSNNTLEKTLKKKNLYKIIKKTIFSWRGYWSDRTIFYQENTKNISEINNDSYADKNNVSKLKYKLINHYTKSFMKPLLIPILDIHYYLPDFSGFDPTIIFNTKNKFIVNMDIDKIMKLKEEQKKKDDENVKLKENYLRQIYIKSNPALADKLLKISDSLDLGKEEEFSVFKEEKDTKNNAENNTESKAENNTEKEDPKKSDNNKKKEEERKYYLCCLVKTSHHIKGVCFVDDENINFKVFLNQKTGEAMAGVNIGFTNKDDDYDEEKKTCFGSYFMFHQKDKNLYRISINYNDIKFILFKRYYFKNSGLEIFTTTNKSYYFNFKFEEERDLFMQNITSKLTELRPIVNDLKSSKEDSSNTIGYSIMVEKEKEKNKDKRKNTRKELEKIDNKKIAIKLSKTIKDWTKWKINNFEFLMWINFFGNRSYNDISQYPVFPWILSNFDDPLKIEPSIIVSSLECNDFNINPSEGNMRDSSRISSVDNMSELESERKKKKKKIEEEYNYRDMKLPMGIMELNEEGKKRKNEYMEHYKNVKDNNDEFEGMKPYYYGSNYSNPIYVCNFLMRLFPFTHISIELQGNKLDDPNRLFLSVFQSFHNSISLKADLRELIPEFFYLPEMFLNINDINLGKLENDSLVYNVTTPCKNNAYSFIEIMKRIFENGTMSTIINNWVDLIFGYKAKGKEAENAKNVFMEESYQESIDLKNIDIDKKIVYLKRVEFGLIPSQVFIKECPKRDKKKDIKKEKELTEYNMGNIHKIKVIQIKHDSSNDKNMKSSDGNKSKLLKADIFVNDKIMMLYDNNTIIDDKIGSSNEDINCIYKINPIENQINISYLGKNINKIIKFCNFGMTLIVGGYYDGRFEIINIEEKVEKSRLEFHPFSEEEPILNISINKEESFLIIGNSIGNIAVYKMDIEYDNYELYKRIFNQMSPISDININDDLNLFATGSIDGYVTLYTLPLCKRVRSIKVPIDNKNNGKFNYVFLSESSLPSIIMITENDQNCEIFSYSINGQLLVNYQEDKNMESPLIVKDLNSFEYLIYYANSEINIRNLPSLSLKIVISNINNVKYICVNEDLSSLFAINKDGSQIQAIRD